MVKLEVKVSGIEEPFNIEVEDLDLMRSDDGYLMSLGDYVFSVFSIQYIKALPDEELE